MVKENIATLNKKSEVKVIKTHKDTPSVIEWNGNRYILDIGNRKKS
ncbi:MAG TPA: hypothetical protein VK190_04945 [Pseudoneobacillus sp.]|nr:hypothetical protein [Pseudoneobacillus sp.]